MATPPLDEQDDATDPLKLLFPGDDEEQEADASPLLSTQPQPVAEGHQVDHHFLRSVNSTVAIRQLRSQGLSFQLWPAATTFVSVLDDSAAGPLSATIAAAGDLGRLRILELGSGTGLVGIAAAVALGADVTVTDLPHVLPNLHFNAEANASILAATGGTVRVATLRWGEAEDVELIGNEFDLVLGSDVVYYDYLYDPLLKTLKLLFEGVAEERRRKKMVFVMAHMRRWKKESAFFKKARKIFDVEVVHSDKPCPGQRMGVAVYRFEWRHKGINGSTAN
ncbi:protein N-lysine methyltransferase METTL21A [Punica granatum]|uniref:Uncharacterized protein n=2 Tax=Punica granatum TaxID=22663 RepID=A0A218W1F0_PUNGR|nr:protein N-lysine methyltransferase METTL21A [Punica granatum]OWM66373.1 hypothetical protein CDL15_Pgr013590 [Punica granatum]PKI63661.1 hypothetical protein CRG98_015949 [Punica granatum]